MINYISKIKDTLLYFDFQPLLFFWVTSDILNNQILWTTPFYWIDLGQAYTYWLYMCYFVFSVCMLIYLHNNKWLARFVSIYLILYLFSTIRYLVSIYGDDEFFTLIDFKNILITCWYAFMWTWILFKLKKEILHRSLR